MENNPYKINIKEFKLEMNGNGCEELRPICQALCCHFPWNIGINQDEFLSGQYDAIQLCSVRDNDCDKPSHQCEYRIYQIKKNEDNSCIYLNRDNLCSIYDFRPRVCRDYYCNSEFNLRPGRPNAIINKKVQDIEPEEVVNDINDPWVFVSHPLIRLVTVIYTKERARLYFVKELIGSCGQYFSDNDFNYPQLDDGKLLNLIHLFDKKEPLRNIRDQFKNQYGPVLSDKEFQEIVRILLKHNLIINARRFV